MLIAPALIVYSLRIKNEKQNVPHTGILLHKKTYKEKVPCRFEKIRSPFLSAADILPSDSYQD